VPEVTERVTHEAWLAEATERFGPDPKKWRFECPYCGHVSSPQDFIESGVAPKDASRAAQECIGRVIGARGGMREDAERQPDGTPAQPCDWAAWGLFGNLGKGPVVVRVVDGEEKLTQAFPFADREEVAHGAQG
jgi:hypothetical protein